VSADAVLIGVDWGTTSFRAVLFGPDGRILERRAGPHGILSVRGGAFAPVLEAEIGDWTEAHAHAPIIASGMITSRQGWVETPYLACPAGARELAGALTAHAEDGRMVHFVTGLSIRRADGVPDVMRGEETQIVGQLAAEPDLRLAVMPGTHSKWVRVEDGRIVWFQTFMTGEVFAALRDHTILGRLMEAGPDDDAAFRRGLRDGAREGSAGALLGRLFAVRTLGLFGDLAASALASYLSGLLIGAEIAEALAASGAGTPGLSIIGEAGLAERYRTACVELGLSAHLAAPDAAASGQFAIARDAGLLNE
jgi:2-dehydro-3-deoxygalactonokinase